MGDREKLIDSKQKLIVLEGPKCCGKTTAAYKLAEYLESNNIDTIIVSELNPHQDDHFYEEIKALKILIEQGAMDAISQLFLILSIRRRVFFKTVLPALEQGTVVIMDRFIFSTYVYQYKMNKMISSDFLLEMKKMHKYAFSVPIFSIENSTRTAESIMASIEKIDALCIYLKVSNYTASYRMSGRNKLAPPLFKTKLSRSIDLYNNLFCCTPISEHAECFELEEFVPFSFQYDVVNAEYDAEAASSMVNQIANYFVGINAVI